MSPAIQLNIIRLYCQCIISCYMVQFHMAVVNVSWSYFFVGEERTENSSREQMNQSVDDGNHVVLILLQFRNTHDIVVVRDSMSCLSSNFFSAISLYSFQIEADENQFVSACSSAGGGKSLLPDSFTIYTAFSELIHLTTL